jgi:hypothetical protein
MIRFATHRENTGVIKSESQARSSCRCLSLTSRSASNGFSLTHDELSASYAIIRHNIRTYRSAGIVEVVKGKPHAQSTLQKIEACQHSSDQYEGWRYFIEKTDQKPGIDPAEATRQRQKELEVRESKAMQEAKNSASPPDTQRYSRQ